MTDHKLMGTCPNCGRDVPESKNSIQRIWCAETCRKAYARKVRDQEFPKITQPERPCVECGNVFEPKSPSHTHCSPKCSSTGKRRRKREKGKAETESVKYSEIRECARHGCGETFEVTNKNASRIYCGNACNRLMYNARRYGVNPLKIAKFKGAIPDYRNHMLDAETVQILRAYQ